MKLKYFLLIIALFSAQSIFCQITFQKTYFNIPQSSWEPIAQIYDIKQSSDSGYILTGIISDSALGGPILIKLDKYGDTTWTKQGIGAYSVFQACDGGYITTGTSSGPQLTKTDDNGNIIWTQNYTSVGFNGYSPYCTKTADCGFIITFTTDSFGAGGDDIYVIKSDSLGNILWSKTYGGTGSDLAVMIKQTSDGGYIILGRSKSFGADKSYHTYLVKTDSNGDTLWTKVYFGPTSNDQVLDVKQTIDHGYIIGGSYTIKTDSIGNVLWSKNIYSPSIQQTSDLGYIILGQNIGLVGLALIKTDNFGNFSWAHEFPYDPNHRNLMLGQIVEQTNDSGYIIGDNIHIVDISSPQIFFSIIKTGNNGYSGCNQYDSIFTINSITITDSVTSTVVTSPSPSQVSASTNLTIISADITTQCASGISEERPSSATQVYPNLVSQKGSVNIVTQESLKDAVVTVFNIMGISIYSEIVSGNQKTILLSIWNKVTPGLYFVRIDQGSKSIVKKIVVVN